MKRMKKLVMLMIVLLFTVGCVSKTEEAGEADVELCGTENPEDGTWRYSLIRDEKELTYVNVKSELVFNYDDGIAVDEYGNVYMLYFSSEPYQIQIYQVKEMPGRVDPTTWFGIDNQYNRSYGFGEVYIDDELYVIKTSSKEAMMKNNLENIKDYPEPLTEEPEYEVVKAERENFDSYSINYGLGDANEFYMTAYMKYDESYEYEMDFVLTPEIDRNYLGWIIPDEDMANVWFNQKYETYEEVEEAIIGINHFLEDWEESHHVEVGVNFLQEDFLIECYPRVAAKYGISRRTSGELIIDESQLETYLDCMEENSIKTLFSRHQELLEEYPVLASQYGNVFDSYREMKVTEENMKVYLDNLEAEEREEFFKENFKNMLEAYPELATEYIEAMPDKPESVPSKFAMRKFLDILEEKYPEKLSKFLLDKEELLRVNYPELFS